MIEIDVRGYSCPIPVVQTKQAIEQNPGQSIVVFLETEVSKENVSRLAQSSGYKVKEEKRGGEYQLTLEPGK